MADDKHPEQYPAEGSRETVERQLNETSADPALKKRDMPSDDSRDGEKNAPTKSTG